MNNKLVVAAWMLATLAGPAAARTGPTPAGVASAAVAQPSAIERDLQRIGKGGTGGQGAFGVAAWRLDGTGPSILINADRAFPMASTFKVAVAGALLDRVDRGQIRLDQMVPIAPERMIASEVLEDSFVHPGLSVSIANLLELMLTRSDNTATDYLVEAAGGPAAVTAWVRAKGIQDLRVDGGTDEIVRRFYGMGSGPFPDALAKMVAEDPEFGARSSRPNAVFDADPRDTASPRAMALLLQKLFSGRTLSPTSTKLLIDIMTRCRTGDNRLRGRMPADTLIADKTGTIGGSVNDVGVITLPEGRGQVVIVVFISASDAEMALRERTIADIARSVRDFYVSAR